MHVAIVGYGKMGREIAEVCRTRGHSFVTVDPRTPGADYAHIDAESVGGADVCIDFTHPSCAVDNIRAMADLGKQMVVGTTGWYDELPAVKGMIKASGVGFIWSPNFSIGVNLYFRLISAAAAIFNKVEDYDVMGYEIHHGAKADSPSGTAIKIASLLTSGIERKTTPVYEMLNRAPRPEELHYASVRGGSNPGLHTVLFDSGFDTIEVSHQNRNRSGLALGAVMAAEFIVNRHGYYEIEDLIDSIIGG